MLNIVPFIDSFIIEWLKSNKLIIHKFVDHSQYISLQAIVSNFIKNKKLNHKIDSTYAVSQILSNRTELI